MIVQFITWTLKVFCVDAGLKAESRPQPFTNCVEHVEYTFLLYYPCNKCFSFFKIYLKTTVPRRWQRQAVPLLRQRGRERAKGAVCADLLLRTDANA